MHDQRGEHHGAERWCERQRRTRADWRDGTRYRPHIHRRKSMHEQRPCTHDQDGCEDPTHDACPQMHETMVTGPGDDWATTERVTSEISWSLRRQRQAGEVSHDLGVVGRIELAC